MKMKSQQPTQAQRDARLAAIASIRPYADQLGDQGMIAVLAYTIGQLIALSDQRKMTAGEAIAIVEANLQQGNSDAISQVLGKVQGHD